MQKKKVESVWTTDITPQVVSFMTMDITPNFNSDVWTQDITHYVVGSLAVFGLVMSVLVTTAGVAAVGVNVEVAFAQQESANQTASALLAIDTSTTSVPILPVATTTATTTTTASTTPPLPPVDGHLGSSTNPALARSLPAFCPALSRTIGRGTHDATTTGDVGQLQQFMANHFGLESKDLVTGFFGSTTQSLLAKFQQEQGIAPAPFAGPLTRSAIARLCNPSSRDDKSLLKGKNAAHPSDLRHGSSTVGSSTPPLLHHEDMRLGSTTEQHGRPVPPPAPTSYIDNSSNAASIIEALNEIGDGYGRLITASLSMLGL